MASTDNVRVRYQDGLILGAAQLSGDQRYFRAALERRSLSRDMFGIAWGLDLTVDTAPAGANSSAIVWVEPGVAYGGDGKPIVVRDRSEITSLLSTKRKTNPGVESWAIYLVFQESDQNGQPTFQFCGQALDPTTTEGFRFEAEPLGAPLGAQQRDGARLAPTAELGASSDAQRSRLQLGIVSFDLAINNPPPIVMRQAGSLQIPEPEPPPTQNKLDKDGTLAPASADYIGVVAAAIAHPRRWTQSERNPVLNPAIVLEPESGIHLEQPTVVHASARVDDALYVGGPTVAAHEGMCVVMPVDTTAAAAQVLNKAVAWNEEATGNGIIAAKKQSSANPPVDLKARVLGIATSKDDALGTRVRVVVAGPAIATLKSTANVEIGDWLVLDDQGLLDKPAALNAGLLVAKVIGAPNAQHQVLVIVCLS